jgi:hypothetical protein
VAWRRSTDHCSLLSTAMDPQGNPEMEYVYTPVVGIRSTACAEGLPSEDHSHATQAVPIPRQ